MTERCPTCGAAVTVVDGREGTSHYELAVIVLDADELEATTRIVGQYIEPYSCGEGTTMRTAYLAWRKLAIARGTLAPEDDERGDP